jgi:hypothetical protein
MASPTKNVLSLFSLLVLVVGTFSTVMIILSDNKIVYELWGQDYYKIGSALAGSLVVLILIYLTVSSTEKSITYKTIIISVLIVGLIAEIIMTFVSIDLQYEEESKYALIVFNFLYRAYYLIGYVQEPWAEMALRTVDGAISTVTNPAASSSSTSEDAVSNFKSKWREIKDAAKAKYPNDVDNNAGERIIQSAVSAGDLTRTKLTEAAGTLKVKSTGEAITGITIPSMGGRRKVRR